MSSRLRRIKNELCSIRENTQPPLLTFIESSNLGVVDMRFTMEEPCSPYHGASFTVEVTFPDGYPQQAPVLVFKNPIPYHFLIEETSGKVEGLGKLSAWVMHCSLQSIFADLYSKMVHLPTDQESCTVNEDMLTEYRNTPHVYIEKARKSVHTNSEQHSGVELGAAEDKEGETILEQPPIQEFNELNDSNRLSLLSNNMGEDPQIFKRFDQFQYTQFAPKNVDDLSRWNTEIWEPVYSFDGAGNAFVNIVYGPNTIYEGNEEIKKEEKEGEAEEKGFQFNMEFTQVKESNVANTESEVLNSTMMADYPDYDIDKLSIMDMMEKDHHKVLNPLPESPNWLP